MGNEVDYVEAVRCTSTEPANTNNPIATHMMTHQPRPQHDQEDHPSCAPKAHEQVETPGSVVTILRQACDPIASRTGAVPSSKHWPWFLGCYEGMLGSEHAAITDDTRKPKSFTRHPNHHPLHIRQQPDTRVCQCLATACLCREMIEAATDNKQAIATHGRLPTMRANTTSGHACTGTSPCFYKPAWVRMRQQKGCFCPTW